MAVARMDHFKIYSMKKDTDQLLKTLQSFGKVHISNLSEKKELEDVGLEKIEKEALINSTKEELSSLEKAIKSLSKFEVAKGALQNLKEGKKNYSFQELMVEGALTECLDIVDEIDYLEAQINSINQEIEKLKAKREDLEPWRTLKLRAEDLLDTEKVSFTLGNINPRQLEYLKDDLRDYKDIHIEHISLYGGSDYLLIVSHKDHKDKLEEAIRRNSFFKIQPFWEQTASQDILTINDRIKELNKQIEDLGKDFLSNTENLPILKLRYDYLNQILTKYEFAQNLLATERVSLTEGYVPRADRQSFESLIEKEFGSQISFDIKQADDDDPTVPTLLENSSLVEPFESWTERYSVPKYNEIDPTPFLAPFYWLFFGMMLADFGYGFLLSLGAFIALRWNLSDGMRKMMKFFFLLGIATMIWGFIYGSIFGGIVSFPGGFRGFVDPGSEYVIVMIISLALGGIHMFTGLGIGAAQSFKDGEPLGALYDYISWIMVVGGAIYMVVSGILGLPGGDIAKYIMILGMAIVVLFTARDSESIAGRIGMGLYNLYGVSGWIGDFVSYLRLLALGLSGAFIGVAINMIITMMAKGGPVGLVFAIIIFVGGHIFNLGLSGLSAYVHTLRLTFVEFFGKFYDGNGSPFRKFRSNTKYINIKEEK